MTSANQAGGLARAGQRHRTRLFIDQLTRWLVRLGGMAVIGAITLIFIYLLWVVLPLFRSAEVSAPRDYALPMPTAGATLLLGLQQEGELAYRVTTAGECIFFDPNSGRVQSVLNLGSGPLRSVLALDANRLLLVRGDGKRQFVTLQYDVQFNGKHRTVTPSSSTAFGDALPIWASDSSNATPLVAAQADAGNVTLVTASPTRLHLQHWSAADETAPLGDAESAADVALESPARHIMIGARGRVLYAIEQSGWVSAWDIDDAANPQAIVHQPLIGKDAEITASAMVLGGYSLLIADNRGRVVQWTLPQGVGARSLIPLRSFQLHAPATALLPEQRRRGLVAIDQRGGVSIIHTTAERLLASTRLGETRLGETRLGKSRLGAAPRYDAQPYAALATRGDRLLVESNRRIQNLQIDNRHPEVSLHSLWAPVWYEGYDAPSYSWQSSSADEDFEPKFSLVPLAFGTLKGAFYALLFALPTAIMGAIYTGYFMAPRMRAWVKPVIEIMAALPTVILGFIAGLWLAPLVEANLAGVLSIFLIVPAGVLAIAIAWHALPETWTHWHGQGWNAAFLLLPITLLVWCAMALGAPLEQWFFHGDMKAWLLDDLHIQYQQRNCFVVGLAMGLAVIPTIFSIAEDAIYGVPGSLTQGSLALGATPWQTLSRVVLLTASPGIFSAAMIGMGRAVGETMIVLMATGNTPILNMSMFQGMRTFAANIAVELPESALNSSHYRILFLTALVLFALTFTVNTIAEVVRQRLRVKYGNL